MAKINRFTRCRYSSSVERRCKVWSFPAHSEINHKKGGKKMKNIFKIITLLALSVMLAIPVVSQAADKKAKSEIIMKMGGKVHLFHSGNVAAQKEISINDVVQVYRISGKNRLEKEIGTVKVLSFIGEHYFEAEIVKGEIKIGDLAKKGDASLLVQPVK